MSSFPRRTQHRRETWGKAGAPGSVGRAVQKWQSKLLASMETGIVLRAVAIVFIVATHIDFFSWEGTAHVLMALAGYNFARFQLTGSRLERLRRQLRAVARIVVPSIAVIGLAFVVTDDYRWHNVFLLNSLVGPPGWTDLSRFWFVEVLVHILLGLAILLVIPGVDRALRRWPWAFPLVLAGIDLLQRFDVVQLPYPGGQGPVLWLFAFGWAAAVSRRWWQRAAMTALALLTIPGSFPDEYRSATILVGFLILLWIPHPARSPPRSSSHHGAARQFIPLHLRHPLAGVSVLRRVQQRLGGGGIPGGRGGGVLGVGNPCDGQRRAVASGPQCCSACCSEN